MGTLLIVDDELFILEGLCDLFTSNSDYKICTANSAKRALEIIAETKVDVILSDICMPEMNGLKLLIAVRERLPDVQIVFLTGYSDFDYLYEAMKYEGVRYLLTTESDAKIIAEVKNAMSRNLRGEELPPAEPDDGSQSVYSQYPIVMLIKNHVDNHLGEDLSLQNLAEAFHFNTSYLSRLYKTVTGINLSDYIFNARIELCKSMLAQTDLKIWEIAQQVGYQSTKSFTRLFKHSQKITPQQYRNEQRMKQVNVGYQK